MFKLFQRNILTQAWGQVVVVLLDVGEGVHLVEHQNHRLVFRLAYLLQGAVDHFDLFLELWVGNVDYMHEYVGVAHLVERRFEGVDKVGWQFADESDSVGEQKRKVVDYHLAHRGVERGKQLVLGKYVRLAEQVHKC